MYIDTYKTQIDWATITTYDEEVWAFWAEKLSHHNKGTEGQDSKRMQYQGTHWGFPTGSAFLGSAEQRGRPHSMLVLSGNLAEEMKRYYFNQMKQGTVRCTRLDLQITLPYPKAWSQWSFFNRIKRSKRITVGWVESKGKLGPLETVYLGSRSSNRMLRLYTKEANGGSQLLRLEVEYKSDRSNAVCRAMAKHGELADNYLRFEIQETIKDEALSSIFERHLLGTEAKSERIYIETSFQKTERWLRETVYPTFARIISSHQADGELLHLYWNAILTVLDQGEDHEGKG